jgi:hypothetical protein
VTLNKSLALIGIGTISLSVIFDVILLSVGADGTALALAMVTALSLGGIANYFAVGRYGERAQAERNRRERTSSAQS